MDRFPPSPAATITLKFSSFIPVTFLSDSDMPIQRQLLFERFQALHLEWKAQEVRRADSSAQPAPLGAELIDLTADVSRVVYDLTEDDGET